MNTGGWIFMVLSWTVIIGIFTYCMVRTLRSDSKSNHDAFQEKNDTFK